MNAPMRSRPVRVAPVGDSARLARTFITGAGPMQMNEAPHAVREAVPEARRGVSSQ